MNVLHSAIFQLHASNSVFKLFANKTSTCTHNQGVRESEISNVTAAIFLNFLFPTYFTGDYLEISRGTGTCLSKAPESFRACKAIFGSSISKNGEVYTPETSRIKGTSLHL